MPLELLPEEKSMETEQRLLTETEVAKLLGLSPRTLQAWRYRGGHTPPFIKVGRSVRYRRADVLSWLRERQRGPPQIPVSPTGAFPSATADQPPPPRTDRCRSGRRLRPVVASEIGKPFAVARLPALRPRSAGLEKRERKAAQAFPTRHPLRLLATTAYHKPLTTKVLIRLTHPMPLTSGRSPHRRSPKPVAPARVHKNCAEHHSDDRSRPVPEALHGPSGLLKDPSHPHRRNLSQRCDSREDR